jgi:hypothetical protein
MRKLQCASVELLRCGQADRPRRLFCAEYTFLCVKLREATSSCLILRERAKPQFKLSLPTAVHERASVHYLLS